MIVYVTDKVTGTSASFTDVAEALRQADYLLSLGHEVLVQREGAKAASK